MTFGAIVSTNGNLNAQKQHHQIILPFRIAHTIPCAIYLGCRHALLDKPIQLCLHAVVHVVTQDLRCAKDHLEQVGLGNAEIA